MTAPSDPRKERFSAKHWQTFKSLLPYLWPVGRPDLKARVVISLACLVVGKAVNTYTPFLYKYSIDGLSKDRALATVPIFFIVAYALARVSAQLFGELRDFVFERVNQSAQRTLGLQTFRHLHQLSLSFHLERQTGGLTRVIERGTRGIQTLLGFTLFNILPTFVEIGLVTAILFYRFTYTFGLITAATITAYISFTLSITNWRVKHREMMNQKDSEAQSKAIDALINYETVKYFNNERHEEKRFDHALEGYEQAAIQSHASLTMLNMGQGVIIAVGLFAVMVLAARGVVQGNMTIGDFVLLNTFLIQLYQPLNLLGFVYRETKQGLVDMDKMFELLAIHTEVQDKPGARELVISAGEIEFKHIGFAYSSTRPILKDLSFKVRAGRSVAIVGASGAGKSTIARLLFRFYDVQLGQILIDGQDIRDVTQASLRAAIGVVPQDTVLFNDTIGYNILYGKPDSTDAAMREAARTARIDEFVQRLPEKYETKVGERGLKLSGGEKQRVAIARTVLKQPQILIFDEATSALDTKTEKEIQESLQAVSKNRTTVIIAHRLSTVVDSDEIIVLKEGAIAERGRHADLLSHGGEYAQMWAKQQQRNDGGTITARP